MNNELLMPFDSDDPEFTRGFETGQLWAALERRPDEHEATLHAANAEMARRCATAMKDTVHITPLDSTWISTLFMVIVETDPILKAAEIC